MKRYADQSKYLFEYVLKNHTDIRAIWLRRSQTVYDILKSEGRKVYLHYLISAIMKKSMIY